MKFTVKGAAKVIAAIRSGVALEQAEQAMYRGMIFEQGRLEAQQFSGRKGGKYLNRQTGTLARSGHVRWLDNQTVQLAYAVPYAAIHQWGGWTGRGHKSYIPKRLYILEEFADKGIKRIGRTVYRALFKEFGR